MRPNRSVVETKRSKNLESDGLVSGTARCLSVHSALDNIWRGPIIDLRGADDNTPCPLRLVASYGSHAARRSDGPHD